VKLTPTSPNLYAAQQERAERLAGSKETVVHDDDYGPWDD
jgi:hypothetical protein